MPHPDLCPEFLLGYFLGQRLQWPNDLILIDLSGRAALFILNPIVSVLISTMVLWLTCPLVLETLICSSGDDFVGRPLKYTIIGLGPIKGRQMPLGYL